jgi:Tol biopolymer transport system component
VVPGRNDRGELVRYDATSKQVVPYLGGISANQVAFSKDGKSIVYVNIVDSTLWDSRADGTGKVQLTYQPGQVALPRWSPDGSKIVFMSAQTGKPWKVFVVPAQGGTPEELLPTDTAEADPAWSPDGGRMVFSRLPDSANASDIRILDLNTRQLTILPGSTGLFSPRWSPEGRYIAALDFERISKKVVLFDFKTGKWSDWFEDPKGIAYPAWTSDGKAVEYGNSEGFSRVKLGSSSIQHLFTIQNINAYSTNIGSWTSLTPDNSVMYTRDVSTQDLYMLDVDFP